MRLSNKWESVSFHKTKKETKRKHSMQNPTELQVSHILSIRLDERTFLTAHKSESSYDNHIVH